MNQRCSGFTLVEIIGAMLLLAVLAVVVVPRAGRTINRVPGASEMLLQNLVYARSRAMSTTNTWTLVYGGTDVRLTRDGTEVPLPDPETGTMAAGVTISGGGGSVTFDTYGAPDEQKVIAVSDGVSTRTITVWAETGMIE